MDQMNSGWESIELFSIQKTNLINFFQEFVCVIVYFCNNCYFIFYTKYSTEIVIFYIISNERYQKILIIFKCSLLLTHLFNHSMKYTVWFNEKCIFNSKENSFGSLCIVSFIIFVVIWLSIDILKQNFGDRYLSIWCWIYRNTTYQYSNSVSFAHPF